MYCAYHVLRELLSRAVCEGKRDGKGAWSRMLVPLLSLVWAQNALAADCGANWVWRNPLPQGNSLYSVAWGDGRFVAVGDIGTILTSPDGAAWTVHDSGVPERLNGIAWGGGQFVAVGNRGTILTSPDGAAWTARDSGTFAGMNSVAWGGGQFVAVGDSGNKILTSPDGTAWTARDSGTTNDLSSVVWSGSQFVAVGRGNYSFRGEFGVILTSPDGAAWTVRDSGAMRNLNGIAWSGSQFVAVGTEYSLRVTATGLKDYYASGTAILTSPDGTVWTARDSGATNDLNGIAWSGSQFMAVGAGGTILTSPDGAAWTARDSGPANDLNGIVWGGGQFVAVGDSGTVLTSPDGAAWTARDSGVAERLNGIVWGGGQFVAVGSEGTILASPDGVAWTVHDSGGTIELRGIAWSGSQFVAVGSEGTILTSPDGAAWTVHDSGVPERLNGIAWSGSQFVAAGGSDMLLTSPDGAAWTVHDSGAAGLLYGIAWGGGQFVAVGEWNTILTSPDGADWEQRGFFPQDPYFDYMKAETGLNGIAWSGGQYVAVGSLFLPFGSYSFGMILTSPDGADWTYRDSGTTAGLNGIAWSGSRLVAVGNLGTILTSECASDGITVIVPNRAPIANAGPDQTVLAGGTVLLDGRGSADSDDGPISLAYQWTQTGGPAVTLDDAATATPRFFPTAPGEYTFSLTVSDGLAISLAEEVVVRVEDVPVRGEGVPVRVLAPNGGEVWKARTVQTVRWHASATLANAAKPAKLQFAKNGGKKWVTLKKVNARVGSFSWKLKPAQASARARLRICLAPADGKTKWVCDASDGNFVVQR
jgi:hypothetical protein